MGKKNLEQLFKEKLGDFHEIPDEKVWNSIESSLDKKKQRKRVVPIWWRLGGAAAVLAILVYVINPFGNNEGQIVVSETESTEASDQQQNSNDTLKSSDVSEDEQLVNGQNGQDDSKPKPGENAVADVQKDNGRSVGNNQSQNSKEQLATTHAPQTNAPASNKNAESVNTLNNQQHASDAIVASEDRTQTDLKQGIQKDTETKQDLLETVIAKDAVTENNSDNRQPQNDSLADQIENQAEEEEAIAQNDTENLDDGKQSIFDAIAEQEEEVIAQSSSGKWSIGPSVAPVYFSASGEGSPVHSSFATNSKSGNVDLSYGLTVAYEIGKKLKVRTGVHRVNYGYDTNDVVFTSSLDGSVSLFDNIDYSRDSQNIVLESKDNNNSNALANDKAEVGASANAVLDGKMVQQLGYLEIPLELNYSLIDKKFGIDLIGGVSSLFLVDNSVLLESEGLVTEVGEANNANSMNFSTNVGVGFNYEFSPKVQLNVEPVFKYQLNTFSDTSGSFRPFSVGVYSGVRFKF